MVRLVLLRILESYFRHRWLYLLPIVAMSAAAMIYIAIMPAKYVVNGTLYIQADNLLSSLTDIRSDGYSYVTPAQATTGELYQLLNAKAFLRAIIQKTDMEAKMAEDEETAARTIDEAKNAIWLQELGNKSKSQRSRGRCTLAESATLPLEPCAKVVGQRLRNLPSVFLSRGHHSHLHR